MGMSGVLGLLAGGHLCHWRRIRLLLLLLLLRLLLVCGRATEDVDDCLENVQKAHDGHGEGVWEE
jgi:hypothetical protein